MYSQEWQNILNTVDDFMQKSSGCVWFRGHSSSIYPLKSGLFRLDLPSLEKYIEFENKIYTYYKNMGYLLHNGVAGWQLLYSLQHHGGKTRLLDWSESFAVAVYFALRGWGKDHACIWMLDPNSLNYISRGAREIITPNEGMSYPESYISLKSQGSIAVYPIKNTVRIGTQQGVFTVQGNSLKSLNEEFDGALIKGGHLQMILLDNKVRADAKRFIKQNGINHFSLFPELDGLAKYLNDCLINE